jgi:hypothetical protein
VSRSSWTLALAIGASACLAVGCLGLFEPETPEPPPVQTCATDFTGDYSSPTAVLGTLSGAMQRKSRGRCAYLGGFADSATFRSTFPADLIAEREAIDLEVPAWRLSTEGVFYDDFMELTTAPYALVWSEYPEAGSDTGTGSDSTLYRRYVVTPSNGIEILAAGTAVLTFRRQTDGTWALAHWADDIDLRREDPDRGIDRTALLDMTMSQRRLEAYDANF